MIPNVPVKKVKKPRVVGKTPYFGAPVKKPVKKVGKFGGVRAKTGAPIKRAPVYDPKQPLGPKVGVGGGFTGSKLMPATGTASRAGSATGAKAGVQPKKAAMPSWYGGGGGGGASSGGGGGAPPVGAGAATGTNPTAPGSTAGTPAAPTAEQKALTIDDLYKPAYDALTKRFDQEGALKTEAQNNLAAFREWQAKRLQSDNDALTKSFADAGARTQASLTAIGQSLANSPYAVNRNLSGLSGAGLGDAATQAAVNSITEDVNSQAYGQRVLGLRNADQTRMNAAMNADLQTGLDAMMRQRRTSLDREKTDLDLKKIAAQIAEQQAARQAAIDEITANALAGEKADRSNQAWAKIGLDRDRLNASIADKDRNYQLSLRRLQASGTDTSDKTTQDMLKAGLAARKRAEAGWEKEVAKQGKPFTPQIANRSMQDAIVKTATLLRASYGAATADQIIGILSAVYGPDTVARFFPAKKRSVLG